MSDSLQVALVGLVLVACNAVAQGLEPALVRVELGGSTNIEIERTPKTSTFVVTHPKGVKQSPVGSSFFSLLAFCDVAKARGTQYVVILKESRDGDGTTTYVVGFTNRRSGDLKKEFGAEFTYVGTHGEVRERLKVARFDSVLAPMRARSGK